MANDKTIWEFLKSQGLNDYGAAGLMGNLYAESGLSPTNLQNTYNNKFGMTDDEYTAAVDAGRYGNFVHDSAGYGLAQWTFWSRKQGLYDYAKSTGRSIGDLTMQLEFLFQELSSGYKSVLSTLKSATSVLQASNSVLLQFERPADQSVSVQNKRASYGQNYYNQFAGVAQEGGSVGMSNSPLVEYTRISPNRSSPRKNAIDRISIHCVVGQVSIQSLGSIFAPSSKEASSNYGIGYDGRVGMYVEEKDRSWCTSSAANDNRAVTIEVASDTTDPYAVTDAAYAGLLNLVTDICKRNGKNKVVWFGDKAKTLAYTPKSNEMVLTVHRWFANKACPGNYLYNLHPQIVAEVNRRLAGGSVDTGTAVSYQVKVTADAGLNCRTAPINGTVIMAYEKGTILNISKEQSGWGFTGTGWVSLEWTEKIASTTPVTEDDEDMTLDTFKKLMNEYRAELRDNDCGDWSKAARDWATSTGLFAGSGNLPDGTPNYMWADMLTREQAAQLFYNFAQKNGLAYSEKVVLVWRFRAPGGEELDEKRKRGCVPI